MAHKKNRTDVKWHALQNDYLEISKCWVFAPQNKKKTIFFKNLYKIQNFQKIENTGIYIIETYVYYLHANF